jgi:hypothetical protein
MSANTAEAANGSESDTNDLLCEPPFCAKCGGTCQCEDWVNVGTIGHIDHGATCSFCGLTNNEVAIRIKGVNNGTFICDDCVRLCNEIVNET